MKFGPAILCNVKNKMGEKNSLRHDVTNDDKVLNKLCEVMLKLRRFF